MSTATASPRPICLTATSGVATNPRNTTTMIAAAAEITRAVTDTPRATAAEFWVPPSHAPLILESRNTS